MNCSFPGGATTADLFWRNQVEGRDCITKIPDSRLQRFEEAGLDAWRQAGASVEWGGFLDDVDTFDATFFRVGKAEAESMDPQQRKLLELTWSTIEAAGYNPRDYAGTDTGIFVGAHSVDYAELIISRPSLAQVYGAYLDSGVHPSLLANRVSWWFDFKGPSEVINTACSSGLVAVHRAVESITTGQCSAAIAAGINLILTPRLYYLASQAGMLAPDGRCKTFSSEANGFARAEGFGAVLLKPYRQALIDRDTIHGIIRGSGVSHGGRSWFLRTPSVKGQRSLLESVYVNSRVSPDTVTYIEAHGTGTALGDPLEVQALKEAFGSLAPQIPVGQCGLGTVKSHIGHCESAAGLAGLIKVLMALRHSLLPGLLHFTKLNPRIELDSSPFRVIARTQPWDGRHTSRGGITTRRAGVSSFGFGGVNAHIIVEEHRPQDPVRSEIGQTPALVVLSAASRDGLSRQATQLLTFLRSQPLLDHDLLDVAYTLQVGRDTMACRFGFPATSLEDARLKLTTFIDGTLPEGSHVGEGDMVSSSHASARSSSELGRDRPAEALARWAGGSRVDWRPFHSTSARRVPLPTYPFARERYWLRPFGGAQSNSGDESG